MNEWMNEWMNEQKGGRAPTVTELICIVPGKAKPVP